MDKIRIIGGKELHGTVKISGAKNATLPLMTACLLSEQPLTLTNVPHLADVTTMATLLASLGVVIGMDGSETNDNGHHGRVLSLDAGNIAFTKADYELVRKMRASVLVLGPLLARCGKAMVSLPGGCAIGTRPVDLHIQAMEALGAKIELQDGYMHANAPNGLIGSEIEFPFVSVGATENALMAASLAKGRTIIHNAAREPEITDLVRCLNAMGAKIFGVNSDTLIIDGVSKLHKAIHNICADRIEAGTYAVAAAICGGELTLQGINESDIEALVSKLKDCGVKITASNNNITVKKDGHIKATHITTAPFPGFPTDLQAQMMTLMTLAEGESEITETIFENRFMHVPELMRMGADIKVDGSKAIVKGVKQLKGAQVMATDLRASVSLVLAGLAANGETVVNRIYHLDRGYEHLEEKLSACGASIERIRG
ncbi:MAG: UDP-N-acetylglucosamine 1-carboxyvinyltransferase [Alphaproteobacteria bacterium]|nr:MAG: UDP-N-acetylglucosamine 1-carboxyvinyltransferase [Alphaproteobacteria bacterium]